jgi:Cytochrome c7 and related cytochrome c
MSTTSSIRQGSWISGGRFSGAALCIVFFATIAAAQLSPGPLSKAHQSLNGVTQCTNCHTLRVGSAELKCQECHTEIAQRLTQKRGLHATLVKNPADTKECATCHSEHNGVDFDLIHWTVPLETFDHRQTGYALEGKHAGIKCEQCHAPAHIRPAERSTIKTRDLTQTYLGLSPDCVSCHEDPHAGRLGATCTQCHNFTDWKAASGFDHSRTRYPLTGLHAQVACEKCHTAGPQGTAKLTGLAFGSCQDCHQDPHKGSFAQTCETCHATSGWRSIRMPASFDHSKTDFPLEGKHTAVGCAECHAGGDFKKPIAHAQCMDCHKPDPHQGQFRQSAGGAECASCHTVDSFQSTTYGLKEHAESRYPLLGKHAQVECAECHKPAGTATKFKTAFGQCLDCHVDEHRGQFAAAPRENRCEDCHAVQGFRPAKFSLTQHQAARYALDGAHVAVPCLECHRPAAIGGVATAQYHFTDQTCTACHSDPHDGQFQAEMKRVRADGKAAGCQACHTTQTWRNPAGFDHSQTEFPLTGAHRSVTCAECHTAATGKASAFNSAPKDCEGCHQDPHGGQFVSAGGQTSCTTCHADLRWAPSSFDHNRDAAFSLEGAHQNVPCASCHQLRREVNRQPVLFYKPTPTACADCHTDQQQP